MKQIGQDTSFYEVLAICDGTTELYLRVELLKDQSY